MAQNRVQFQRGMSQSEFTRRFGSEEQCAAELERLRWPDGFRCPRCDGAAHSRISRGGRPLFQCTACRHQASLTAGTMMDNTKLPLSQWFIAMYLIAQAKTGLSGMTLMHRLGVSYRTAWTMHHKIMQSMAEADAQCPLSGNIQLDDGYLGGEQPGTGGRGSENKVPFVAAVEVSDEGRPLRAKMTAISGFTSQAVKDWSSENLKPGSDVLSDGLACFGGVIDAGCAHTFVVVGQHKPRDLPQFKWVNTVIGNLKTMINGAHKHFDFVKYSHRYLGAFCYRFNNRFDLCALVTRLFGHVVAAGKMPERVLRRAAESHA
jgi:transposase-like protein